MTSLDGYEHDRVVVALLMVGVVANQVMCPTNFWILDLFQRILLHENGGCRIAT